MMEDASERTINFLQKENDRFSQLYHDSQIKITRLAEQVFNLNAAIKEKDEEIMCSQQEKEELLTVHTLSSLLVQNQLYGQSLRATISQHRRLFKSLLTLMNNQEEDNIQIKLEPVLIEIEKLVSQSQPPAPDFLEIKSIPAHLLPQEKEQDEEIKIEQDVIFEDSEADSCVAVEQEPETEVVMEEEIVAQSEPEQKVIHEKNEQIVVQTLELESHPVIEPESEAMEVQEPTLIEHVVVSETLEEAPQQQQQQHLEDEEVVSIEKEQDEQQLEEKVVSIEKEQDEQQLEDEEVVSIEKEQDVQQLEDEEVVSIEKKAAAPAENMELEKSSLSKPESQPEKEDSLQSPERIATVPLTFVSPRAIRSGQSTLSSDSEEEEVRKSISSRPEENFSQPSVTEEENQVCVTEEESQVTLPFPGFEADVESKEQEQELVVDEEDFEATLSQSSLPARSTSFEAMDTEMEAKLNQQDQELQSEAASEQPLSQESLQRSESKLPLSSSQSFKAESNFNTLGVSSSQPLPSIYSRSQSAQSVVSCSQGSLLFPHSRTMSCASSATIIEPFAATFAQEQPLEQSLDMTDVEADPEEPEGGESAEALGLDADSVSVRSTDTVGREEAALEKLNVWQTVPENSQISDVNESFVNPKQPSQSAPESQVTNVDTHVEKPAQVTQAKTTASSSSSSSLSVSSPDRTSCSRDVQLSPHPDSSDIEESEEAPNDPQQQEEESSLQSPVVSSLSSSQSSNHAVSTPIRNSPLKRRRSHSPPPLEVSQPSPKVQKTESSNASQEQEDQISSTILLLQETQELKQLLLSISEQVQAADMKVLAPRVEAILTSQENHGASLITLTSQQQAVATQLQSIVSLENNMNLLVTRVQELNNNQASKVNLKDLQEELNTSKEERLEFEQQLRIARETLATSEMKALKQSFALQSEKSDALHQIEQLESKLEQTESQATLFKNQYIKVEEEVVNLRNVYQNQVTQVQNENSAKEALLLKVQELEAAKHELELHLSEKCIKLQAEKTSLQQRNERLITQTQTETAQWNSDKEILQSRVQELETTKLQLESSLAERKGQDILVAQLKALSESQGEILLKTITDKSNDFEQKFTAIHNQHVQVVTTQAQESSRVLEQSMERTTEAIKQALGNHSSAQATALSTFEEKFDHSLSKLKTRQVVDSERVSGDVKQEIEVVEQESVNSGDSLNDLSNLLNSASKLHGAVPSVSHSAIASPSVLNLASSSILTPGTTANASQSTRADAITSELQTNDISPDKDVDVEMKQQKTPSVLGGARMLQSIKKNQSVPFEVDSDYVDSKNSSQKTPLQTPKKQAKETGWACESCTTINQPLKRKCQVCDTHRIPSSQTSSASGSTRLTRASRRRTSNTATPAATSPSEPEMELKQEQTPNGSVEVNVSKRRKSTKGKRGKSKTSHQDVKELESENVLGEEKVNEQASKVGVPLDTKETPKCLCFTGFKDKKGFKYTLKMKDDLMERAKSLGATIETAGDSLSAVTHVISPPNTRTAKTLKALLDGKWIISPEWLADSVVNGFFLPEKSYGKQGQPTPFLNKSFFLAESFIQHCQKSQPERCSLSRELIQCGGGIEVQAPIEGETIADYIFVGPTDSKTFPTPDETKVLLWQEFLAEISSEQKMNLKSAPRSSPRLKKASRSRTSPQDENVSPQRLNSTRPKRKVADTSSSSTSTRSNKKRPKRTKA